MSYGDHKYIVLSLDGKEAIYVFPLFVDHDSMADACESIRFGSKQDWKRLYRMDGERVSAGFVSDGVCHGRSETLNLESRGDIDTALLRGVAHG